MCFKAKAGGFIINIWSVPFFDWTNRLIQKSFLIRGVLKTYQMQHLFLGENFSSYSTIGSTLIHIFI